MAIVVTMDQKGDTKELLGKYDIASQHLMANQGPPKGLIAHYCLETPDGIRVSNVWESEEQAQAGAESPVFKEALAKAQMPPTEPQFFPVHNHFIVSEMQARA